MTTYTLVWGAHERRQVTTVDELDNLLDHLERDPFPRSVGIYLDADLDSEASPWDEPPRGVLELGVGHPDRSFVVWLGPGGGIGDDPALPAWPAGTGEIAFDYGGDPVFCGPDRARVTPALARQAAREFLTTGQRPRCLQWTST